MIISSEPSGKTALVAGGATGIGAGIAGAAMVVAS